MASSCGRARPLVIEVLARGLSGGTSPHPSAGRSPASGGESYRLFALLDRLHQDFGDRIAVYLIEPFSLVWFARVIRYRPRRYPVFILGGREAIAGLDEAAVVARVICLLEPGPA